MKLKVIIHKADEGGYWEEVPSIPGCATEGKPFETLLKKIDEAVEGCLYVAPSVSSNRFSSHISTPNC